eukprot:TRINITY_DN9594_c0_g1_i1.p1 TRINITY_DN9594_c0_g1~~TRINITY_DN9594_c0_g1_i1.p1  ORF type:complete len:235 (+),score=38.06 TRINITY_DN9594_c0_g1_i1:328-1032(+)
MKSGSSLQSSKHSTINTSHPNIIKYREAFFDDTTSCLCIVMEYADGGDLYSKVTGHVKAHTRFSEQEIWLLFGQMCAGLDALHKLSICHRDLKSANMFIAKGQIKIGDLNVSKVVKSNMLFTRVGTPYYTSPEIWNDKPYNHKSDMWSLGCVLYEMCALKPPFMASNMRELSKRIIAGLYPKISSVYSAEMTRVIRGLLQTNPNLRFSCCTFALYGSSCSRHTLRQQSWRARSE